MERFALFQGKEFYLLIPTTERTAYTLPNRRVWRFTCRAHARASTVSGALDSMLIIETNGPKTIIVLSSIDELLISLCGISKELSWERCGDALLAIMGSTGICGRFSAG